MTNKKEQMKLNRKSRVGIDEKRAIQREKLKVVTCPLDKIKCDYTKIQNMAITLLDSEAFHVYSYLLMRCMGKESCYPSTLLISEELKINKNKIPAIIEHLQKYGLVRIETSKKGTKYNNIYYPYAIKTVSKVFENEDGVLVEMEQ